MIKKALGTDALGKDFYGSIVATFAIFLFPRIRFLELEFFQAKRITIAAPVGKTG